MIVCDPRGWLPEKAMIDVPGGCSHGTHGICEVAGKACLAPCSQREMLMYDPKSGECTTAAEVTARTCSSICAASGKVFLADGQTLIVYDTRTDRASTTCHDAYIRTMCASQGKVFVWTSESITIIDASTGESGRVEH
eukprot:4019547-Amphidinium_carterae.2